MLQAKQLIGPVITARSRSAGADASRVPPIRLENLLQVRVCEDFQAWASRSHYIILCPMKKSRCVKRTRQTTMELKRTRHTSPYAYVRLFSDHPADSHGDRDRYCDQYCISQYVRVSRYELPRNIRTDGCTCHGLYSLSLVPIFRKVNLGSPIRPHGLWRKMR